MIRVNLRRGSSTLSAQSTAGTRIDFSAVSSQNADFAAIGIRGGILLVAPIFLIYMESNNLDRLRAEQLVASTQLQQIEAQVNEKKKIVSSAGDLQAKAKELANKLQALTKLSRLRLREVKALDYVQSIMPEKVWLNDLVFKANNLEFKGAALTDDDLSKFVKGLENSAFFTNVVLVQAQETKGASGAVRQFEIHCTVENPN